LSPVTGSSRFQCVRNLVCQLPFINTGKECNAERFSPDVIVSTTAVKQPTENVKMFRGVAFLTGVDEGQLADEIANALKS
jgi:fructose-bisphosphate aldolase class 1